MKTCRFLFPALGIFLFQISTALGHKSSDSYLFIERTSENLRGEWHLALRDLEDAVGLDSDEDGVITWGELKARQSLVTAYAWSRLHLSLGGQKLDMIPRGFLVDDHSDGAYAVLRFETITPAHCAAGLLVEYRALFDLDPSHRGLLRLRGSDGTRMAVFAPETPLQQFALNPVSSPNSFPTFVREGIWHIWAGYDHILFLVALLLPGVLRHCSRGWEPVDSAMPAFRNVLKIVTAFTLAHSITLSLAALGLVQLPVRLVEAAIAASVVLAALNNLTPFFAERGWMVAFGFGLIHGFGFANALRDLGLHSGELAMTLFGFNLGVEIGQLTIVLVFLPIALGLRRLWFYRWCVLRLGSAIIMTLAATWFAERVFDLKWLPF